ncbi:hypothetical protein [Sphingomonas crocodyli]|uniref:Uncharacterized protein n=1 Tax=Sphingomonas crocodyli TaxID=1979270 RepID=A0A437M7S1_9SPHN|nr:hypothetical protein [Sphingomonas crocodyli]RVT93742.1 hypothetical protein EOD43_07710 [Sphingomonas crocodyli]
MPIDAETAIRQLERLREKQPGYGMSFRSDSPIRRGAAELNLYGNRADAANWLMNNADNVIALVRLAFQQPGGEASTIAEVETQAKALMDHAAGMAGLTVSEWVSARMRAAADRALTPAPDAALREAYERAAQICEGYGYLIAAADIRSLAATPSQKQGEGL